MTATNHSSGVAPVFALRLALFIGIVLLASLTVPGLAGAEIGVLDGNEDFKLLSSRGFAEAVDGPHPQGTPFNSYAWSMAWFKNALFVGTLRMESADPVKRGQIWRYTPAGAGGIAGTWKMVYQSGAFDPQDYGYRWMTVCDAGGTQRLYVTTMGALMGRILYSNDGVTFKQASMAGLKLSDHGYRPLVCFKDPGGKTLLLTSPVAVKGNSDLSDNPIVYATDNPISGTWRPYSPLRFGDPTNDAIFSMEPFVDKSGNVSLYAGIANYVTGGQIWKTGGCSPFPCVPTWTKVVDKGAGRPLTDAGALQNVGVSHFVQHNSAMYAGLSNNASDGITAELIRIDPDDDKFDLIIGQPRLDVLADPILNLRCTDNDCPPLSGRGAGFGPKDGSYADGTQSYFWHMLSYESALFPQGDDRLYVGSRSSGLISGFTLLATDDGGVNWVEITKDGLGQTDQEGTRAIVGSPIGMFIGGANYARVIVGQSAVRGCDVFLGTCDPALARPPVSDPRAVLKAAGPGQVLFDGKRYIAYDDENYPNAGNGKVAVKLESRSYDPFCGEIVDYKWDAGDLTASCGSLPGDLGTTKTVGPLTLCTSSPNAGDCDYTPSASTTDFNEYTFTLQVTAKETNLDTGVACNKVVVRASKNLRPKVTVETDPPAVLLQGLWTVGLLDFDGNGSQPLVLKGMCTDPEGLLSTCTWAADAGVTFSGKTLPFQDADPGVLGTAYTVTVPVGSLLNISLTAVDDVGNKTSLPVIVGVCSTGVCDPTSKNRPSCQGVSRTIAKGASLTVNAATDLIGPRCLDPEGQPLSYIVTKPSGSAWTVTTTGGTITFTPPDANYLGTETFTLQACDPSALCSYAVGVRVSVQDLPSGPPAAPASASASVVSSRTIRAKWVDVADETRYEVQQCRKSWTTGTCSFSTVASNLPPDTTSFDYTVSSQGTYRFRVRACTIGCSSYTQAPDVFVQ